MSDEEFNRKVEEWHKTRPKEEIHTWLGMSYQEYVNRVARILLR